MKHRYITCFGETKTITEWAKETGLRVDTIAWRIDKSGLSPEEALTKPVAQRKGSVNKDMTDFTNRNRSTYTDPTSALGLSGKNARPGEIWTSRKNDDEYLVIKNHDGYCNTLLLKEDRSTGMIEVQSHTKMYTNPGMMAYCFHTQMGEYVKTMPASEFKKITDAVSKALDLSFIESFVADEYEEKLCACMTENEKLRCKVAELDTVHQELTEARGEIAWLQDKLREAEAKPAKPAINPIETDVLRLQAQTYKQMYDELLERILGKRAI